ncbi:GDSL esterase/lipase [Striga hermonthica]|uniref:GDSL esterase/lipase n=1 Tax=Striga hermonthica TaxID=68872 RepID=A0A9N7NET6_STRHE|nr:GDSL esterase/lipase [Striga hermonthica]
MGTRITQSPDAFVDDMIKHLKAQLTRLYQLDARKVVVGNELNENLEGATFVLANVYDLVMELITNYAKYGFTSASKACCGDGGPYAGIVPCGPASSMCKDRDKYVFWDPYHPSEAANVIIAKQLLDGDAGYVSPINIRELWNL